MRQLKYLPMWCGHCKISVNILLRIPTLLMADEHKAHILYLTNPTNYGRIIISSSVTVKLYPLKTIRKILLKHCAGITIPEQEL